MSTAITKQVVTAYHLPLSIISNRRTIDSMIEKQDGIDCTFHIVTDISGRFLSYGPLCYIGIEGLIRLHSGLN